jgi:hypothetical protein
VGDVAVRHVRVERVTVVAPSSLSFDAVIARIDAALAHPDPRTFFEALRAAPTLDEVAILVERTLGGSDFIEFARFDTGMMLRKAPETSAARMVRFLVGNPLIMNQLARVPDAGSYAPVSLLVDLRVDGVHLSYDRMASLLADSDGPRALDAARDLDRKVERLLVAVATS